MANFKNQGINLIRRSGENLGTKINFHSSDSKKVSKYTNMLRPAAALLLAIGTLSNVTHADVLTATNGDRVTGTFIRLEDGIIFFQTEAFGVVQVPEDRARVELTMSHSDESEPVVAAADEPVQTALVPSAPEGAADPFQNATRSDWEKQVEFGLMAQNGRRNYSNYSVLLDVTRHYRDQDELRFFVNRYYGKADGAVSTDSTAASANFKKGISKDFFVNTTSSYESDSVKGLNHDAVQGVGVGMNLLDREGLALAMGAGAGIRHRELTTEDGQWDGLVDAFENLTFALSDRLTVKQRMSVNAVPDLQNDFQVRFKAALVSSLTKALDMSVRYEFEYDGSIEKEIRNIERIVTSIGYAF